MMSGPGRIVITTSDPALCRRLQMLARETDGFVLFDARWFVEKIDTESGAGFFSSTIGLARIVTAEPAP